MRKTDLIFNILSPPRCMACNRPMKITSDAMFCFECSKTYRKNSGKVCLVCGRPVGENSDKTCTECKTRKIWFDKNVSRYLYKGCVKDAVRNMKFKSRRWIAFGLGNAVCETVLQNYADIKFDMVIDVPMTKLDERKRGFNQSFEFAEAVSEKLKIPHKDKILRKMFGGKTQSGLSRDKRFENVKDKFVVIKPDELEDKVVLLVDDVFTTGATLNECARVLKKSGALAVFCVTAAAAVLE